MVPMAVRSTRPPRRKSPPAGVEEPEPRRVAPDRESAAESAPAASEQRYRGLFQSMLEGCAYCRMIFEEGRPADYLHLDVNPAFEALTGLVAARGKRISELIPNIRAENPELFAIYGRVVATGEPERFETYVPALSRWYSISVFRPEAGCFAAIFEDVTERNLADRALRESRARYEALVESSALAILVDRGERIVLVNSACLTLFGAERRDELVGRSPYELFHPDCHERIRERIRRLREEGETVPLAEERIVRLDGRVVDVEVTAAPFVDQGEQAIHVVLRDASGRKAIEARVRRDEERLRLALEGARQGLYDVDFATGEVQVSPEYARMLGYDPTGFSESVQGWIDRLHPDDRGPASTTFRDYIEGRIGDYRLEFRLRMADGSWKWILSLGKIVERDDGGRPLRMLGTHTDITERKAAEEALASERSRLRAVLDTIPDLVWLKDPGGSYLSCNPAFERLMGLSEAELVGRTDYDFADREHADAFRAQDHGAILAGGPVVNLEQVTFAADGRRAIVETIKTPMRDHHGELLGVLGIARDVTEARATAEALRRSEERLRLFVEHAPAALAMFDRDLRYLSASRRWRSDYGLGDSDLTGRRHYDVSPDVRDDWREVHRRGLAGEVVRAEEDRFVRPDGTVQWICWEVRPWHDSTGAVAGIVIFSEDITERKRAAQALAESEAHFRALAETTFDWIWEIDAKGRYTFVSPRISELLGYLPDEVIGRTPISLMPEAEAARVRALFLEILARREPFAALENVNRHRDGRLIVLETSGVPVFGPDGGFRGYRGMGRDVTARKRAERRSAAQAAVSRALADSTSLAEAAPRVLEAIARSEGWRFGVMWMVDRGNASLHCSEIWSDLGAAGERLSTQTRKLVLRRGEGLPGRAWAEVRPALSSSLADDSRSVRRSRALALGLESALAFPIVLRGEVLGVAEFLGREAYEPDAGLIQMLETLGGQLGQFVERTRAEAAVARFVSASPAVIYALEVEPERLRLAWVSENLRALSGWTAADAGRDGWWTENFHPEDRARVEHANAMPYSVDHQILEFRFRRKDGSYFWVRDEKRLLRDDAGRPSEVIGSWTDVTARVQLEEQLRIAQKLEAIGRLAGGVAHDFNNILTVISGNGELLAKALPQGGPDQLLLGEIRDAGERAAALTRQLLAFSRSQVLAPQVLDLNAAIVRVEGMLRRLIGEDIELTCVLAPETGHSHVDPGQLEQVIVNLAVNARDAMPRGGRLTLESRAVELDAAYCGSRPEVSPGRYALLAVSDTGTGMSPAVRERIFEPFFTTKAAGVGTGLGLSTVFGIVKQSGGHIEVESEPGRGTCFRIYLPQVEPPVIAAEVAAPAPAAARGHETILLVEDEEGVRRIARIALETRGYRVVGAADGRAAMAVAESRIGEFDLLVTDLVMPGMSGRELADVLRVRQPGLKVLFMSGYVEDALVRHGIVEAEEAFIHKPFSLVDLAAKVRAVLDAVAEPALPGPS
jgi:two-component system cell cycle sensor histidine kinase/response regulator CckA